MVAGDKVSVTVFVEVPIADAFTIFTEEIDRWWRRGPAYRLAGRSPGTMTLEPKLGGKFVEHYEGKTRTIGVITVWEPPKHLVFEWRAFNFEPDEKTTVELWFESSGEEGTRVKLEHRGWASIRSDHPVRHGKPVEAFIRDLAMWWGGLMTSFRETSTP